jgi:uncharacterized membrane protein YozB (DUF420 family)
MYTSFLFSHSMIRWFVLISLLYATWTAFTGYRSGRVFTKTDNAVRHWTATIVHIQLMIGFVLYFISPLVAYFLDHPKEAMQQREFTFFGILHIGLMIIAVVVITIGSALAKRRSMDKEKFRTMFIWFGVGLLIILIATPWPFSPLAARPYYRAF